MLYDPRRDIGVTGRVLLGAADILERHGWCQGYQRNDKGQYCANGAINRAVHELGLRPAAAMMARARLHKHNDGSVLRWNDALGMTKEQVVGTLRALAFTESACDDVPLRRGK